MAAVGVPLVGMGSESGARQTAKRRSLLRWTLGRMEEKGEVGGCAHRCFGEWAAEGRAVGMLPRELSLLRSTVVQQTRKMLPQLPLKQKMMGGLLPRWQHQPQEFVLMAEPC